MNNTTVEHGKSSSNFINFVLIDLLSGKIERTESYDLGEIDYSSSLSVQYANIMANKFQLEFLKPLHFPDESPAIDKVSVEIINHSDIKDLKMKGTVNVVALDGYPDKLLLSFLATPNRALDEKSSYSYATYVEFKRLEKVEKAKQLGCVPPVPLAITAPSDDLMEAMAMEAKSHLISKLDQLKRETNLPQEKYEVLKEKVLKGEALISDDPEEVSRILEDPDFEIKGVLKIPTTNSTKKKNNTKVS